MLLFIQDFQLRRQMLLKRFEVTIQTFLDKAAPSNSEQNNNATPPNNQTLDQQQIRLAIESQQQYLHNKPLFFEVCRKSLSLLALLIGTLLL